MVELLKKRKYFHVDMKLLSLDNETGFVGKWSLFHFLCIRVHACKEKVDTEVRHSNAQECQRYIDVIDEWFAEDRQTLRMYHHGINHEGNECPRLLAIPAPVCSPTDIRPDGTDEDSQSHRSKGRVEEEPA